MEPGDSLGDMFWSHSMSIIYVLRCPQATISFTCHNQVSSPHAARKNLMSGFNQRGTTTCFLFAILSIVLIIIVSILSRFLIIHASPRPRTFATPPPTRVQQLNNNLATAL